MEFYIHSPLYDSIVYTGKTFRFNFCYFISNVTIRDAITKANPLCLFTLKIIKSQLKRHDSNMESLYMLRHVVRILTVKDLILMIIFKYYSYKFSHSILTVKKMGRRAKIISTTRKNSYTGLFEMIVAVLTTCHTQYT
jgi:hypothetical protein